MAKRCAALMMIGALLCLTTVTAARDGTVDETEFWQRLEQTAVLLEGSASAQTITQVNNLWRGVDHVRLQDGTVIQVDVNWLRLLPAGDAADVAQARDRARAILNFHARYPGENAGAAGNLARLDDLLRSPAQSSSAQPVSSTNSGSGGQWLSPSLSQTVLIVGGLIVVAALLYYLWQMLQIQPVTVDLDSEAVPGSSQAAAEKAEELKAVSDYRAAIRQLYLASLLALDEQRIIRFDASLTNREHLDQLRDQPHLRELMTQVVTIFDRVWYGFAPADESLYRSFRQYLDQLRQFGR